MAAEEDAFWETGKCSGTMYSGDHEHYRFLNEAFGLFAHVNVLQRDMCPSATKFEGEIIAMALDLMHADAVERHHPARADHQRRDRQHPARHARLSGVRRPGARHRRLDRAAEHREAGDRAPGLRQGGPAARARAPRRPGRPTTRPSTRTAMAEAIDDLTIGIVGSACNYGYGTIDPIAELGRLALDRGVPPARRRLPRRLHPAVRRAARLRRPAVRLPGARRRDDLRGHPQVRLLVQGHARRCCSATRRSATRSTSSWSAGAAASTCRRASRARGPGGLLAATWAAMVQYGRRGLPRARPGDLRDGRPR